MAPPLSYREQLLLTAFRACDARGQALVEQIAADQAIAALKTPVHETQVKAATTTKLRRIK